MDDLKVKKDPNCEEFICKQESLYNKYKIYISKDEDFSENQELNQNQISNNETIKCPIGKDTLGFYSWNYLHTMAAYYPDKPTEKEKSLIQNLIESFAYFYPCKICSSSFQKDIKIHPLKLNSNKDFSVWLCERHNTVNLKLGKELFDCNYENLQKRWKTGYPNCSKKTL